MYLTEQTLFLFFEERLYVNEREGMLNYKNICTLGHVISLPYAKILIEPLKELSAPKLPFSPTPNLYGKLSNVIVS